MTATGQASIIITDLADHFGTFYLTKSHNTNNSHVKKARKRIFSENNIEIFRKKLKYIDFTYISLKMCPSDAYSELLNLNLKVFNESFPMVEISSKTKQPKNEPWCTSGLRVSSKTKAKLLLKKLSIPSKHNI